MASSASGRKRNSTSTASRGGQQRRTKHVNTEGVIPVLARAVREIERAAEKGKLTPSNRTKFLVIAVLMRKERTRVMDKTTQVTEADRTETLRRLDGVAGILARTAARDTSLIALLESDTPLTPAAQKLRRDMLLEAGVELDADELIITTEVAPATPLDEKQVVPQSVIQRSMANPFLAPDFSAVPATAKEQTHLLSSWELIGPLLRAFEHGSGGQAASMALPEPTAADMIVPGGLELMPYQARFIASVRRGHRTFLLADEPGLGKTAQSLLAASVAGAYPLLAVVPNVVKMNWAREVERWTPQRTATIIHGDGTDLDAFADIVIVNYDVLDRHIGWLGKLGFKGMVVDEAHFIKNLQSQRSKHVLALAEQLREGTRNPLMMALTGTPLINSLEDFRAIWQFLGWIDEKKPRAALMGKLEEIGLTPMDFGFFVEARRAVIDMGIVRRKKIDVATDLPARRVADMPVELDDAMGRSIRQAEADLASRLVERYRRLLIAGNYEGVSEATAAAFLPRIPPLIRQIASSEFEESKAASTGENVFTMVRKIGQAKAVLAADYAAQLANSVGKVVFFAKHIDVMDTAEQLLAGRGIRTASIRGDQTAPVRQAQIDAFTNDPEVKVIVCSLTAAGVGVNLQVASNVVLAELSWTAAEQTQAIDRVHRIGQEEPVTAWRILAAQTIDAKIAELIDSKASLAARALDGDDSEIGEAGSVQLEALVSVLSDAVGTA